MTRTPLMHALQRLAREHASATEQGITVAELRQQQTSISRRHLLKGAGALIAGVALTDPLGLSGHMLKAAAASNAPHAPRIAILGAGIAGLNAALTLHDAGYHSTIYEASTSVGGRMHSNTTTWENDQVSEWCGELIDTSHSAILQLVQRFGLSTVDLLQSQPANSEDTYYFFGKYYKQAQADIDFVPVNAVLQNQLLAAPFPTQYNSSTSASQQLDHTSVYDWIAQYVPGGHTSPMGQLLDVAYNIEFGRETKDQSSLNLVYLLGFQPTSNKLNIFGSSDERYHIVGGNQRLPKAIAASLPAGTVQLQWRMTEIVKKADNTLLLTFATPHGQRQETFDRVILTMPFSVLRTLDYNKAGFDTLKQTAITQLGYGTNSKLQLQFDTRYWHRKGPWPGISTGIIYTDIGFQNTWDVSRGQPGSTGILVDYTGGIQGASYQPTSPYSTTSTPQVREYAERFLHQLNKVWPGISAHYIDKATLSYPTGDPNLLGSYSCWRVGQYTSFSGYEGVRQGKIHFAGEHCSTNYQGFMEGAAEEGSRAATEILQDYQHGIFP